MIECTRCGRTGPPAPAQRIAFMGKAKDLIAASFCAECWQEWEGVEIKVINENRLNFMDPQHREMLKRACADFFQIEPQG